MKNLFDPNAAGLTADQCPITDFNEVKNEIHNLVCGISEKSLSRDAILLAELQKVKKQVSIMDPENAAETIAAFKEFMEVADKDGNGIIDGLAELLSTSKTLTIKIESLLQRAGVVDERITQLSSQTTQTAQQAALNAQEIATLKDREDKEGISEAQATVIAKREAQAATCAAVKAIANAAQSFTDGIKAIDCGQADHAAFMAAGNSGDGFTPTTPDGSGSTAASSTSTSTETSSTSTSTATETSSADAVEAEAATAAPAPSAGAASF